MKTYGKLVGTYKWMMGLGSFGVASEVLNHYQHDKYGPGLSFMTKLPGRWGTFGKVATKAGGWLSGATFAVGVGGYLGQATYCAFQSSRGQSF